MHYPRSLSTAVSNGLCGACRTPLLPAFLLTDKSWIGSIPKPTAPYGIRTEPSSAHVPHTVLQYDTSVIIIPAAFAHRCNERGKRQKYSEAPTQQHTSAKHHRVDDAPITTCCLASCARECNTKNVHLSPASRLARSPLFGVSCLLQVRPAPASIPLRLRKLVQHGSTLVRSPPLLPHYGAHTNARMECKLVQADWRMDARFGWRNLQQQHKRFEETHQPLSLKPQFAPKHLLSCSFSKQSRRVAPPRGALSRYESPSREMYAAPAPPKQYITAKYITVDPPWPSARVRYCYDTRGRVLGAYVAHRAVLFFIQ